MGAGAGAAAEGQRKDKTRSQRESSSRPPRSSQDKRSGGSLSSFLAGFQRVETGVMSSQASRGAFDPSCAGIEGVASLEHGLLKAQESGLFAPGELLVTAVSTKDMLVCYAGGGCSDVLGATSEELLRTSLFDGLHADDVRNLVFAFHMFPTILPEVRNAANGGGSRSNPGKDGKEVDSFLPLPDEARLLPHGYLRRRLANGAAGAFVLMERLGGVIITNNTAAAVAGRGPLLDGGEGGPAAADAAADADADDRSVRMEADDTTPASSSSHGGDDAAPLRISENTPLRHSSEHVVRRTCSMSKRGVRHDGATVCDKQYPGLAVKPGNEAEDAPCDSAPAAAAASAAASASAGTSEQQPYQPVLNKYHPSQKREAGSSSAAVGRSAASDPSTMGIADRVVSFQGRALTSSSTRMLSPHATMYVAGGAGGAGRGDGHIPAAAAASAAGGGVGGGGGGGGASGHVGTSRSQTVTASEPAKTSEAELNSLVAHCVRHNKKASTTADGGGIAGGSGGAGVVDDSLPEEIKDVLRRLTRETFSDDTMLVTIERVRHVGSYGGVAGEARHNSQMMVVSKLLNDLVTRRQRAVWTK